MPKPKTKKRGATKTTPYTRTVRNLAKRLEEIFASLPENYLYALTWTTEQKFVWFDHRKESTIVGKCLRSRLCGTRDPIVHLKNSEVKEERIKHALYWKMTNYYESLLGLTQALFDYLEKAFKATNTPFPFNEPADYFISSVTLEANTAYEAYLQATFDDIDLTTDDKRFALMAKTIRFLANPLKAGSLNPLEAKALAKSFFFTPKSNKEIGNIWFFILYASAQNVSRYDDTVAFQYRQNLAIFADIWDAMGKVYSDARKRRNNIKIRSEYWVNGKPYARP
jgi:hypothetical protein